MNKVPIIAELVKYLNTNPLSCHTPGHKGGRIIPPELKNKWPREIWQYDVTEIFNLDNLHNPTGCIETAQNETARLYNAKASYFLVNGTSVGLQAAILALANNKPIFVPRNVHKSVYNGLILANAEPIYLPVVYDENLGFPLGLEPQVLKEYIQKYPRCKNLIVTHPTYQGISYKIEEIMSIALAHDLKVIVDEAHGSHTAFHNVLPPSALSLGAHIAVQSWHKTLPVLTQASVLHVGHNYKEPEISPYLNMLQTTSPSYLLLASLDSCRAFLATGIYDLLEAAIRDMKYLVKKTAHFKNLKIYQSVYRYDPFKICLSSPKITGFQLAELLREKYGIYVEMAEDKYCLIILGIASGAEILDKIAQALVDIEADLEHLPLKDEPPVLEPLAMPQTKLLLREAFFRAKEVIPLNDALGRIAGDFILKYPPGIPLLVPGEVIDEQVLKTLKNDIPQYKIENGITVVKEGEGF